MAFLQLRNLAPPGHGAPTNMGGRHSIVVDPCVRVVRLPPVEPGRYTALLLFPHTRVEQRHADVRLSGDARVAAYLGAPRDVRSVQSLRVDSDAAYEASIDDCAAPCMVLAGPGDAVMPLLVTDGMAGPRRWFAGLVVVAALVTAYDAPAAVDNAPAAANDAPAAVNDMVWWDADRAGELYRLAAAVVRLPDGRHVVMPGAYEPETTSRARESVPRAYLCDNLGALVAHYALHSAAWHRQLHQGAGLPGWRNSPLDREARRTTDAMDASMASPVGAAAQLAAKLAPTEADAVRDALRPHMARFVARPIAAARIRRTWLRYDGAPHGPRGRFLRDLERGWRPEAPHAASGRGVDALRLFADRVAYEAYADDRRDRVRRVVARSAPADRVGVRLASLLELQARPRPDREAGDATPEPQQTSGAPSAVRQDP